MTQNKVIPTSKTATVNVPEGMTIEEFLKGVKSFSDTKIKYQKIGKADTRALARLRKAHAPEFLKMRKEEWKKEGLDPSNLK